MIACERNLFLDAALYMFLPWLLVVSAIAIILYIILTKVSNAASRLHGALIFGFTALGGMVGIATGASLTPVVGTVLPAFLTFVSGVLVYLFGRESLSEWRHAIPFCLIGLLLASLYMSFVGTGIRADTEAFQRDYDVWLIKHKNILEAEKEFLLAQARRGEPPKVTIESHQYQCHQR